jgi:hypothetical protein
VLKKKKAVEKKAKTIEKKSTLKKPWPCYLAATENHETQSFMNLFYHEGGYVINF